MMKTATTILLVLICLFEAHGQRKIKLKRADKLRGSMSNNERVDWVIGHVIFVQNKTVIYCDSAQFFRSQNSVDAYGAIRITDGDSVVLTAKSLRYDGNKKIAYLRENVVFKKKTKVTLTTDFLDFDRMKNEIRFFNNGKLVDTDNTLTSQKGYFDLNTNMASFKTDVVGITKDYTINSDTLQYNSDNKFIYFHSHTKVVDQTEKVAYYDSGYFDTAEKTSVLGNGDIQTPSFVLKGTTIYLDNINKSYRALGKVILESKEESMNIYGNEGYYNKETKVSKIFGNAYIARFNDETDTLFIAADTLVSIDNDDVKKRGFFAFNHVRIYKKDLQGVADSLAYKNSDSTIYFYGNPVLWANENQLTADSVKVLMKNKTINTVFLESNSFVASEDSLKNYNQIKGRKMTAYFADKAIQKVVVEGNGESLYFALQEKSQVTKDSASIEEQNSLIGMNKIICSNMKLNFLNGKINNISFYIKPEASFIPPHQLTRKNIRLNGFSWHGEKRPSRYSLFEKFEEEESKENPKENAKEDTKE